MAEVLFRAKLQREGAQTAWGFRLQGGVEYNKPLTLLKVTDNSIASKCGLHAGDIVVKLAGKSADDMTHKDAQQAIVSAGNVLEIIVERDDVTGGKDDDKNCVNDKVQKLDKQDVEDSSQTSSIPSQHNGPVQQQQQQQEQQTDNTTHNNNNNTCVDAMQKPAELERLKANMESKTQNSSNDATINNIIAEKQPPLENAMRSPDTQKKSLNSKVTSKPEPSDTGQDSCHSDSVSLSDDNNAQHKTTKPVINKSDDNKIKTILGENVRDKRLKFINWASSSTSSDSDDSVSIRVANRERMLPSPVSHSGSHHDSTTGTAKDSKYPWRRARPENRDTSLHVRSVSEPARHTLPEDQIGSSHLPKKSVSVANLAQNETVKVKPLKSSTLEAVKEEVQDDNKNNIVFRGSLFKKDKHNFESKTSDIVSPQSAPSQKQVNDTDSKPLSDSNIVPISESQKAQQTTPSAMQTKIVNSNSSNSCEQDNYSNAIVLSDSEVTNVKSKRKPTLEDRASSNSQYTAPTQEDIYFAAADPDLVGISMPTVKSMVANLNNRLELIAAEHPKIAQPATPTELGLTFPPKDSSSSTKTPVPQINVNNSDIVDRNSPSDSETVVEKDKPLLNELSVETVLNNNNNSNKCDSTDGLTVRTSSPTKISPAPLSPKSPGPGDRKVRFADPPESSVIEIEPSERRRRRALSGAGERRREDKYPEFYQKKVDDDHMLSLCDKDLLISDDTTDNKKDNQVNNSASENVIPKLVIVDTPRETVTLDVPDPTVPTDTEKHMVNKDTPNNDNKPKILETFSPSFEESKVKIPDIAFTTCSVKELADRLDKIERENELSNLKLRSMRMTREEGDKPLVAMDITGRTYSITPTPVIPREKPQAPPVCETIPAKSTAKPKFSISMETKPSTVYVTKSSSTNISSYQLAPPKSKSVSVTPSSPPREGVTKPPPPYYTNIPVTHTQQPPQHSPQQQQSGNVSPNYQREHISPIPLGINTPVNPPPVQYKIPSPRRSPVQQEELDYYKQRFLPQEAPPPYSALHSYEYYKKLPGAARRNSTGGLMLQTQHLGSGRGFTFSIGSGQGGSGQINVVFSQQEGGDQPTQVAFQIPRGSQNPTQPSQITYSLSPRDGSPGVSINYQAPTQQSHQAQPPPQLTAYHKPGQSFDESKIIQISYPPTTLPQRASSSSPRPHSTHEYYSMRPQDQQQQQRPLFVRTDSPLMRSSSPRSNNISSGRGSPFLSPPSPHTHHHPHQHHPSPPRLQQHQQQQQPHSVTYISPGASPMLYDETSSLSQSRSFKNLENKFIQGVPQPVASARPYIPETSPVVGPSSVHNFHPYPHLEGNNTPHLAPPPPPLPHPGYHPTARTTRGQIPSNMDVYALSRTDMENMPPGLFAFFDKSFSERFIQWQNQRQPGYHQSETLRLVKEMDQEQKHYDGGPFL